MGDRKGAPCSCGSKLFYESTRASGWWKSLVTVDGEVEDTDLDGLKTQSLPKTVICVECGKRNPNPRVPQHKEG